MTSSLKTNVKASFYPPTHKRHISQKIAVAALLGAVSCLCLSAGKQQRQASNAAHPASYAAQHAPSVMASFTLVGSDATLEQQKIALLAQGYTLVDAESWEDFDLWNDGFEQAIERREKKQAEAVLIETPQFARTENRDEIAALPDCCFHPKCPDSAQSRIFEPPCVCNLHLEHHRDVYYRHVILYFRAAKEGGDLATRTGPKQKQDRS